VCYSIAHEQADDKADVVLLNAYGKKDEANR